MVQSHTASLYLGSAQVLQSPSNRIYVAAEGKSGATITLDHLRRAPRRGGRARNDPRAGGGWGREVLGETAEPAQLNQLRSIANGTE